MRRGSSFLLLKLLSVVACCAPQENTHSYYTYTQGRDGEAVCAKLEKELGAEKERLFFKIRKF